MTDAATDGGADGHHKAADPATPGEANANSNEDSTYDAGVDDSNMDPSYERGLDHSFQVGETK